MMSSLNIGCSTQPSVVSENSVKKPVFVKTVAVVQQEVQQTSRQPATVHAYHRAEIRARVSGYVAEVKADIGDVVNAGDVLAVISMPEMDMQQQVLEAKVLRQKAEESRAIAGIGLAEANVASQKAQLKQASAEVSRSDAMLAAAESEFSRTSDLVDRRSLESRMLDEARQKRDAARASRQAMMSAITSAEAEVGVAEAKLASAKADVAAAKAETRIAVAELEELSVLMKYAVLKAPFSGLVTGRSVEPGNLVREAREVGMGKPLFVISDVSKVRIHVPVPEADAAMINPGDVVTLKFPSFPGQDPIVASVTRRTGDLDPATRTMKVEIELENSDGRYLPGMFGEASVDLSSKMALNILPARAVRFTSSGDAFVYVVGEDKKVTITDVNTGFDDGNSIEITSGLVDGQLVVDAHRKRLQDGQTIEMMAK
ncbi:MAG: efflux RND transporter periplasmic adaptor subunit [Fuerstiella sp.]